MLFNDVQSMEEVIEKYPKRNLGDGAIVTRFAPSPTGFLHIGGAMTALLASRMAQQSDGVFILRIEDTDKKREVDDGVQQIVDGLEKMGIQAQESPNTSGEYGPYVQSEREDLYRSFAKKLLGDGNAYTCFCTEDD